MRINEENRSRNGHVLIWDQPDLNMDDKKSKSKKHIAYYYYNNYTVCFSFVAVFAHIFA